MTMNRVQFQRGLSMPEFFGVEATPVRLLKRSPARAQAPPATTCTPIMSAKLSSSR